MVFNKILVKKEKIIFILVDKTIYKFLSFFCSIPSNEIIIIVIFLLRKHIINNLENCLKNMIYFNKLKRK